MDERNASRAMRFVLSIDEDPDPPLPFVADITLGRHLDNDLVLAGEDVADYHARIEIGARDVQLVPLSGCVVEAGGSMRRDRLGLVPGDRFAIGMHRLRVDLDVPREDGTWTLVSASGVRFVLREADTSVGRSADCALRLTDGHASRHHAAVGLRQGSVWIRDLQSSNGTFINGERISGACRAYHGDVIAFDTNAFQLLGDHPDLTPVPPRFKPS
jgi:hypothetical protein